jgi:HK97 family phage major capsid protein
MKTVEQILDDGFAKFVEAQDKSIALHDEKIAKVREEGKAEIADLEKRADGWLKEVRKEFRAGGAFRTTGATSDAILDVLDEKTKGMIPMAEAVCRGQGAVISRDGRVKFSADQEKTVNARPFYDDPILKVACGKWLQTHIQKQQRPADFSGERREAHEKLTLVLNGFHTKASLQEVSTEGLEFVPTVVEGEILRLIVDNSELRPLVRVVPMTSLTHNWPRRKGTISAVMVAEEIAVTDQISAAPFENAPLTARKMMSFGTVSGELLQDNIVGLVDYLSLEFAEQFGLLEDQQALEGDGTPPNFTGVASDADVNEIDPGGATGDPLSIKDLVAMKYTARQKNSRRGAIYFIATTIWGALVGQRASAIAAADGEGQFLFNPSTGISVEPNNAILGSRVIEHSGIKEDRVKSTSSDLTNLYYGPPQTIIFGDRLGMQVDLNPFSKFANFQTDIRALKRTGILVGVPTAWTRLINIDISEAILK